VTPYGSAQQIVSGTLAYALAAGKAIVSTPYEYAIELLADGRGVLTPFDDVEALGDRLLRLLADVTLRDRMRRRAWEHGRSMIWREVGARHLALLEEAAAKQPRRPSRRPAPPVAAPIARRPAVPVLVSHPARGARNHLDRLSDGVGIAQHAVGVVPDLRHGYCTDDVARALVVDLLHAERDDGPDIAASIRRQLTFLGEAFEPMSGRFRNLRAADGRWLEDVGSQDAHGRGVQALGEAIGRAHDVIARRRARELFDAALPAALELDDLRPWAYVALGCDAALAAEPRHPAPRRTLAELGGRLADAFGEAAATDPIWPWPAPIVTYDNGAPPQALIVAGRRLGRRDWVRRGADILRWLAAAQRNPQGHLRPIGNRGWWPRDKRPAWFDQQPIEALSILEAALAAEEATGGRDFGELAEAAYGWFLGANDLGLPVADPDDGACHDGLGPDGLNANRGAESTLAWLLAVERMRGRHAAATQPPRSGAVRLAPAVRGRARLHVGQHVAEPGGGDGDRGIGGAVVDAERVGLLVVHPTAGEDDVVDVAGPLIVGLGTQHPVVAPVEDDIRLLEVQERQPGAVQRAGRRGADAVVHDQPAIRGLQRRRPEPDLAGVPPAPLARLQEQVLVAPVAQIR
jgi:hypothetical protein